MTWCSGCGRTAAPSGGATRPTSGSAGGMFINNTILTEPNANSSANVHWINNLMLGQNSQPAILAVTTYTNYSSSDYNGFRPNPGSESFGWNSPPFDVPMILADGSAAAKVETRRYPTLEAYQRDAKQDLHSVLVDYDVFVNVKKLDAKDLATVQRLYKAEDLDFRLKPGSAAVDRGVDRHAGAAAARPRPAHAGSIRRALPLPPRQYVARAHEWCRPNDALRNFRFAISDSCLRSDVVHGVVF